MAAIMYLQRTLPTVGSTIRPIGYLIPLTLLRSTPSDGDYIIGVIPHLMGASKTKAVGLMTIGNTPHLRASGGSISRDSGSEDHNLSEFTTIVPQCIGDSFLGLRGVSKQSTNLTGFKQSHSRSLRLPLQWVPNGLTPSERVKLPLKQVIFVEKHALWHPCGPYTKAGGLYLCRRYPTCNPRNSLYGYLYSNGVIQRIGDYFTPPRAIPRYQGYGDSRSGAQNYHQGIPIGDLGVWRPKALGPGGGPAGVQRDFSVPEKSIVWGPGGITDLGP